MVSVALLVLSCGHGGNGASPSPTTSRPASPRGTQPINPLTGLSGKPSGPVVGVKIDDSTQARPQIGVNQADVVYVEIAEGGLTRLLAIYASNRPSAVGPVRSVRRSDTQLLGQYGPIALAFSGGAAAVVASFHQSSLVDASADAHPQAYHRAGGRSVPHNLVVDLSSLSGQVSHAAGVRDIGLTWTTDKGQLNVGRSVSSITTTVGSTRVSFMWDAKRGKWLRTDNGNVLSDADGQPIATPNVVIQYCKVTPDFSDVDQAGNPSADTQTVGQGKAVIFRQGRMLEGSWSRKTQNDPTHFTDSNGKDIPLSPGGAWILNVQENSPLTVH